jgi:serine/threonine-protein kinase
VVTLADRYDLLEQVGEGGMGVVWRARDRRLGRDVAIKLLHLFVARDPEQRRRFEREARTLAGLDSEHVVRVYDYVDTGDQAFLVMEYVDGGNLAETTFGRLPLDVGEAAWYATAVAEALACAHGKGVIHRDLTPANVLIERDTARVVTTDFGLARAVRSAGSLTGAGVLLGTPEYWSPEQAIGREQDAASDMYALGCILFLLLSGRPPFEGGDRLAVGLRRAHEDPPSLQGDTIGVPASIAGLVDSLLSRDPARRPDAATTSAALADLWSHPPQPVVSGGQPEAATLVPAFEADPPQPSAASAPTLRLGSQPPSRVAPRGRRRLAAAAAAAVAAVVGVIVYGDLRDSPLRVPNVVTLREGPARTQVLRALPNATVSVVRAYSDRVRNGLVIKQRPLPRSTVNSAAKVMLTISRGSPFAAVPAVAGVPAATARAALGRAGFVGRYRYVPSWTIRKGTVIELRPRRGTRLRRPATVQIVVASGYPREVVPDVQHLDLRSAQMQLEAKHLRYRVVYRLTQGLPVNQVLGEIPAAGATVYRGTRVRLTATRTLRWVKVFAGSGSDGYESDPFNVPERWRIRYRLSAASFFFPALAEFSWARGDHPFRDGGFVANAAGLGMYEVRDGAGTYRLGVNPYAGTSWYVEVDAFE